jgi:hypothetical protein
MTPPPTFLYTRSYLVQEENLIRHSLQMEAQMALLAAGTASTSLKPTASNPPQQPPASGGSGGDRRKKRKAFDNNRGCSPVSARQYFLDRRQSRTASCWTAVGGLLQPLARGRSGMAAAHMAPQRSRLSSWSSTASGASRPCCAPASTRCVLDSARTLLGTQQPVPPQLCRQWR